MDVQAQEETCSVEDEVKRKETAQELIIGRWNWLKTTYLTRGADLSTQTPTTTQHSRVFEFGRDTLKIFENNALVKAQLYEIKYWGEGTNTVDDVLTVRYLDAEKKELTGVSILRLSTSGQCLMLVNSYNDAGGDVNFRRLP
ncbi:hypothetical protein GCM10027275_33830 [Rhabdobacter roseus]